MYDLISIGNISVDMFFQGDSLTFKDSRFQLAVGGKYFAQRFYESVGGGGTNVAIGVSRQELKTAVLGKIGNNPFKSIIIDRLRDANVSTHLCQLEDNYLNISTILLTNKGDRTIVHYTSPHQHILIHHDSINQLIKSHMVYFGNLPDVSLTEREEVLRYLKKNNITTIVNLGVTDCRRAKHQLEPFLKYVDVLIVNGHEFAELVKAPYRDIHFKENVVKWYIPPLTEKLVVITEGARGSYAYHNGKVFHQIAIKPERLIDATGAGDGYTSGFIVGYFKSGNVPASMQKGAKYAAKILSKIGAN